MGAANQVRDETHIGDGEAERAGHLRRGRRDVEDWALVRFVHGGQRRFDRDVAHLAGDRAFLLGKLLFGAALHREQVHGDPSRQRHFDVLGIAAGDFVTERTSIPEAFSELLGAERVAVEQHCRGERVGMRPRLRRRRSALFFGPLFDAFDTELFARARRDGKREQHDGHQCERELEHSSSGTENPFDAHRFGLRLLPACLPLRSWRTRLTHLLFFFT